MILDASQLAALKMPAEPDGAQLATVGGVYADGVALIFDGTESASAKHYRCNATIRFAAGQRVRVAKISGTYIVEYPIGTPRTS